MCLQKFRLHVVPVGEGVPHQRNKSLKTCLSCDSCHRERRLKREETSQSARAVSRTILATSSAVPDVPTVMFGSALHSIKVFTTLSFIREIAAIKAVLDVPEIKLTLAPHL